MIASNFFPEQLLVSTGSSSETLGEMPEINQLLSISETDPVAVDAIGRKVYWYSHSAGLIYSQSLTSGLQMVGITSSIFISHPLTLCFGQQPFLTVPSHKKILALTFDWVGDMIYMVIYDNYAGVSLFRMSIFDNSSLIHVFYLDHPRSWFPEAKMVMNPFTGYVCRVCVLVHV